MAYRCPFRHLVWATNSREPLLAPELEPHVHRFLMNKALELEALVFALDGVEDHLHIVAAVRPCVSLADFVERPKGTSSRLVTKRLHIGFAWQEDYGAFSSGESGVERLVAYVKHQKEHHQRGTLEAAWERMGAGDDGARSARTAAHTIEGAE
jgi:putative transposase